MLPLMSSRSKFIIISVVIVVLLITSILCPVGLKGFWPVWLGLIEMIIIIYMFDRVYVKRLIKIKEGVASLRKNLNSSVPPVRGDLGLVAEVVNELAANLYQSRSLSEQMFDNLPIAVVAFDRAGKKLICNRAAASILNCPGNCEEYRCKEMQNDPDSPLNLLGKTLNRGEALEEQDLKFYFPGGHKHLWVRTDIIKDAKNELSSAMLIAWDVTERNHMEIQLRQAEKLSLVGELAAGMAHEIRNPLTTVKGLTQVISSRLRHDEEILEYTALMLKEIDRINTIIKELLLLSKPSNPALSLVDLPAELDAVCNLLEGKAEMQHVHIEKDFESALPLAVMDIDQMKQVFLNLSSNAISAMPNGGVLYIKAGFKQKEGIFEIIFKDNGKGIPEKNLKKIFDPFYTTKEEGTGLGLAVSYQIVRNHGGKIFVTSEPGRGSTLKIVLPPLNMDQTVKREQKNLHAV